MLFLKIQNIGFYYLTIGNILSENNNNLQNHKMGQGRGIRKLPGGDNDRTHLYQKISPIYFH